MARIQLRAVVVDGQRFGRILSIQHTGTDAFVFTAMGPGQPDLQESLHESGMGHVYAPDHRVNHEQRAPLVGRKGVEKVWRATPDVRRLDWKTEDKNDNKNRRTLRLPIEAFLAHPHVMLDIYLVEHGRPDLAEEVLAGLNEHSTVLGHVLAVECDPHLLLLARALSPEAAGAVEQIFLDAQRGGTTPVPRHWSQVNP